MARPFLAIDPAWLRRLHWDEELSVLEISKRSGHARNTLVAFMKRNGIAIRGMSAAQQIRADRLSPEERKRNALAANAAKRGSKTPRSEQLARAAGIAALAKSTPLESVFVQVLRECGLSPVCQYQVDIFNVDIALVDKKIAVEIDPGHWHSTPRKVRQDRRRERCLKKLGWRVFRCGGNSVRQSNPNLRSVAQRFVADLFLLLNVIGSVRALS